MNLSTTSLLAFLVLVTHISVAPSPAQDASGIKIANLQGADLDLMDNHDPNSELENFELLPGYQVNLFASDPMLANPIHMHWDSRGRLWVACSWAYPQLKPGEVANDKIIILEDTDDDGVADKSTVFADGLYLPTGIELANGGCYVAQSPDIFFLKDTDGDDVADVKELVLTGFGIEDSHHSISAWRRGPDGWLYFQEGIFLHAQVETPYGVVRNFNGGVYQFNPRTRELRMFCGGTGGNPWGHVFDSWGQSFMVNNPRIMYLSPWTGNSGEHQQVAPLISTEKQCGGDLATGSHVGDDLRGQLLTGRFKSRTVVRYEFVEDGAGFSANVLEPLISSKHPNFRPVDVKIGPDGAVYVADWYNSIINHAAHDFRDPRRDHDHGRIWRITHKTRPLVEKPKLVGASIESLLDHLRSPEDWTRHQTRKELSERESDKVLAATEAWVDTLDADSPDYDHHLVEAMWACQNVERVSEKILKLVLAAKDGHARSAGARIIRYWHEQLSDPIAMIAEASGDPFPRTRMEAVLSAGFIPRAEAFTAALNSLDHPGDTFLDHALPQTMKALEPYWQPAMEAGELQFAKPSHRAFAEQGAGIGLERRLADFLELDSPSAKQITAIQAELLRSAAERDVQMLLKAMVNDRGLKSDKATVAMLESLQQLARSKWPKSTSRRVRSLTTLLDHDNESIALLAASNLGAWKVAGRVETAMIKEGSRSAAVRRALAIALARTTPKHAETLVELYNQGDLATRYAAVVGLAHADLRHSIELATQLLTEDPGDMEPAAVIEAILKQRNGEQLLRGALKDVDLDPTVVARIGKFHRETGSLPGEIAAFFQLSPKNESLSAQLLSEDPSALTIDVERLGDAARGELVYRRKELSCTNCHAIGSAGPTIGPNLVAAGGAAKTGYMVESILKPNAAIAEHYENKMFLLVDGTIQKGITTFRNENEVVISDSTQLGKEVRIAIDDIDEELPAPSLMPAGLADQLHSRAEFLDLAKFLSVLGKPGDFANNERPVIRKWRVMAATEDDDLPNDEAAWLPAYSKVGGELPIEDLPPAELVLARGFVNVQVAGSLRLDINDSAGLSLWVDGMQTSDMNSLIRLPRGRHALTFAMDTTQRNVGLRVELKAADSDVKFQSEGGQ